MQSGFLQSPGSLPLQKQMGYANQQTSFSSLSSLVSHAPNSSIPSCSPAPVTNVTCRKISLHSYQATCILAAFIQHGQNSHFYYKWYQKISSTVPMWVSPFLCVPGQWTPPASSKQPPKQKQIKNKHKKPKKQNYHSLNSTKWQRINKTHSARKWSSVSICLNHLLFQLPLSKNIWSQNTELLL